MAEGAGNSHQMQTLENGVSPATPLTPSSTRSQSLCSEIVRIEQQSTDGGNHCRSRFSALVNSVRVSHHCFTLEPTRNDKNQAARFRFQFVVTQKNFD
ncbi:hypothetical protein AVEN_151257-1 [Araneus ventricosus]|uniref:Uncharacterized protein n=1 Tax=Araneus ventricosus TaxID=182803 RepID=A0A4Y2UZ32_ARAVE|nr:hypothetical protein AVEN_151257-1 [Araneus ventricosus]